MLNIFNLRLNNTKLVKPDYIYNDIGQTRHYPPANKEWFNSIYAYNKNGSKLLTVMDKVILKIIKAYFNLYSSKLEKKIKSRRLRMRFRIRSTNRILVSRAELKHSSEKVIVTVYVYNRQKNYYLNKIRNSIFYTILNYYVLTDKLKKNLDYLRVVKSYKQGNNIKVLDKKVAYYNNLYKNIINIKKSYYARKRFLKKKSLDIISKVRSEKSLILSAFLSTIPDVIKKKKETSILNSKLLNYEKIYLKEFIYKYRKYIEEDKLHVYYKQILLLNEFKFKNTYLLPLTGLIENMYNKKVVFNLVNLKYLYLNSYIFTETIVTKLRTRQNRILSVLRIFLGMFKKPPINKLATFNDMYNRKKKIQNPKFNSLFAFSTKDDKSKDENIKQEENISNLDKMLKNLVPENFLQKSKIYVTNTVLDSIKYKFVSGIRLEAAGRLTKRYTAARSLFKIKYKGNIKNLDSSYKGISTVVFRGYAKSNVQFTKLKSKTRIGSFGIKGWISSN